MQRITDSIVLELQKQDCHPFPHTRFKGVGVYAIYYHGSFPLYAPIARRNQRDGVMPIYVGKAVPSGRRKGISIALGRDSGALYARLRDHYKSLSQASNLDVDDFRFRYLRLDDGVIELAEGALIQHYKPVWNGCLDGFGNHDPGAGRYVGQRPGWDEVHPGRYWAPKLQPSRHSVEEWHRLIHEYLAAVESGALKHIDIVDDGGE